MALNFGDLTGNETALDGVKFPVGTHEVYLENIGNLKKDKSGGIYFLAYFAKAGFRTLSNYYSLKGDMRSLKGIINLFAALGITLEKRVYDEKTIWEMAKIEKGRKLIIEVVHEDSTFTGNDGKLIQTKQPRVVLCKPITNDIEEISFTDAVDTNDANESIDF
jgi:hypothetical protein